MLFYHQISIKTRGCIHKKRSIMLFYHQISIKQEGSWVLLWNFETIGGSLKRPKWPKLASLAQKIYTL